MEVEVKDFFAEDLFRCPKEFQYTFRKIFQHLEIADHPLEIKSIVLTTDKSFFKILIEDSRIGLKYIKSQSKVVVVCFLYNQYL